MSDTARTQQLFRAAGWAITPVERYFGGYHHDAFGFGDLLAAKPGVGIALVQHTTGANHAARERKILDTPEHRLWVSASGLIYVVSWRKAGPRGRRKTWQPRVTVLIDGQFWLDAHIR